MVGALLQSVTQLVNEAQTLKIADHVYEILHAKAIEVDMACYENAQYYDKLHRAQQDAPHRTYLIIRDLFRICQNGISLLAMAGLLLAFHWGVVVVLLLAAIPGIFVRLKYAHQMYQWQRQRTSAVRRSRYFSRVLTEDKHAKEIRLLDLGSLFSRWFRKEREQLRREQIGIVTQRSIAELVTEASGTIAIFGAFAFIAYRTLLGTITLGDLVMYYMAFQRAQTFQRGLLMGIAGLYEDILFVSNLYEFLEIKPKVVEPKHPEPVPQPIQKNLRLEQIKFQYPTSTRPVLDDVSLSIRPGEHIALVGENGSGKTTLVKLLCRLYDPTEGRITLDGIDIREFKTTAYRRQISVVFQDYVQYQLTARQNIWLGNIDHPPEHEQIITAAQHSGADSVIRSLPQGYETILGKLFEEGEELSIGQWQKIAIARAFLREAQILILDEPTSALDAKAESEIFKRYHQLTKDRTAILISHRLSTVRMVDTIYVLENGRIVEHGHHDDLIRRGGSYAQLFEKQARHYR
ncbi:MAG: ABC transporter ATP-binding protein [Candidatus Parabeggiatoa sp.]|nr:ABC transporter ATP-binding protein [Candidatus Parabeggiatoa sp.]